MRGPKPVSGVTAEKVDKWFKTHSIRRKVNAEVDLENLTPDLRKQLDARHLDQYQESLADERVVWYHLFLHLRKVRHPGMRSRHPNRSLDAMVR